MKIIDKLSNILWSRNDEEYLEDDEYEEEEYEEEAVQETRQVANGSAVTYTSASVSSVKPAYSRPTLTVHETKVNELSMNIHSPLRFDQVKQIADDLMAHKAAIVNYEKVEQGEQRRICDFLNGVCYVIDGEPRRISEQIVIYVPSGVEVRRANTLPLNK